MNAQCCKSWHVEGVRDVLPCSRCHEGWRNKNSSVFRFVELIRLYTIKRKVIFMLLASWLDWNGRWRSRIGTKDMSKSRSISHHHSTKSSGIGPSQDAKLYNMEWVLGKVLETLSLFRRTCKEDFAGMSATEHEFCNTRTNAGTHTHTQYGIGATLTSTVMMTARYS